MNSTEPDWPERRYAWFAVGALSLANTLSFADRQVMALLLEPIKTDLGLSDTQMSLLSGLGFVILYVAVSLPVARLADIRSRRVVVATALLTLSFMTALCAVARNFTALLTARVGIGASEGALVPAAQSILSDYLPPRRLPLALGVFASGVYIGGGAALLLGGWLYALVAPPGIVPLAAVGGLHGWRLVVASLCVPGVVLSLLCAAIREPPRRQHDSAVPVLHNDASFAALRQQLANEFRVYGGVVLGFSLMIMVGAGTSAWIPAFFVRTHHWTLAQVGSRYGTVVLLSGIAGVLCGGYCAGAWRRRGSAAANLGVSLIGFVAVIPFAVSYPLVADPWTALWLIAGFNFFGGFPFGGGYAALLEITPNRMRAQVAALFAMLINLIGQGGGPTVVALFTDYLFKDERALASSLALIALLGTPPAAAALWWGRRGYKKIRP